MSELCLSNLTIDDLNKLLLSRELSDNSDAYNDAPNTSKYGLSGNRIISES